jgi:predicted glycogen debranching enzyme
MPDPVRRLDWRERQGDCGGLAHEWLVTNGRGGYAAGTVAGALTRRHHGLLIAALPAPLGRTVMLAHLWERLRLPDRTLHPLGWDEAGGTTGPSPLAEFRLELGLPVWRYAVGEGGEAVLEKRVLMPYRQNTVHVTYELAEGSPRARLVLRPYLNVRAHGDPVDTPLALPYALTVVEDRYELTPRAAGLEWPPLRLRLDGPGMELAMAPRTAHQLRYELEGQRGYPATGDLWSPGFVRVDLVPGVPVTLVASTEGWETVEALSPAEARAVETTRRRRLLAAAGPGARAGAGADLVLAADQFLVTPAGRVADEARTRATGDEARTVIAGYPWFTDWGRDTMISLEGLTLLTGRHAEAGAILRTFAHYARDGLIPNLFPEGDVEGLYHTADATLWFFHALDRYLTATGDGGTLDLLRPGLREIVAHHLRGTRFGIGVDPGDGLLRQGAEGYALTWMDAKVGDWVVTPRRGKAVEINALWYNALRLLEGWERAAGEAAAADELARHAERARRSFNARFWSDPAGYCRDVVDGPDGDEPACRPNQLLAIALRHPVLDPARWPAVLRVAHERLLTPFGLRTLAPGEPEYRATYAGDIRARDAAYHQGTVWPWLIGMFVDAWLRVHPEDPAGARRLLAGHLAHLDAACVGTIGEIFDAEPPFVPRGCVAQAWSVAEVLRAWVRTAPAAAPDAAGGLPAEAVRR